jgi:glycosyltransferase involved in cell wall biosynthesis
MGCRAQAPLLALPGVEVLFDYRPALRQRTGVGEYQHELLLALASSAVPGERFHLFSSSWKDRIDAALPGDLPGVRVHDLRVPVWVLNFCWHRLGWPTVDLLARATFDLTHAAHPLRIPSRRGAAVVTVHDLDFLDHPEWTTAEVRRDYGSLAGSHARAAGAVVTSSHHSRRQIIERLGVAPASVHVCPAGTPRWTTGGRRTPRRADGYVLFVGTLSTRKNVGGLLDAWTLLLERRPDAPPLRLSGLAGPDAAPWLQRIASPPLRGRVEYSGYVPDGQRRALFEGASLLVLPSWHEGFGLPALEAMALGVPVVASTAGALPEVVGDAGLLVDPASPEAIADAIVRLLDDRGLAAELSRAGERRAAAYRWARTADLVRRAYREAVTHGREPHARRH